MKILKKLTFREKIILYALSGLIVLSLLYNFVFEPLFKRYNSTESEMRLLRLKLQKAISVINDKEKIEKEYRAYAAKLKSAGSDEQEMTQILNQVEAIAGASDLKIVNMRPKPVSDKDYYKLFIVDIETESGMKSLMKFIYEIKNSPQLLKIDKLRLTTKSGQEGLIIKASMSISKITID